MEGIGARGQGNERPVRVLDLSKQDVVGPILWTLESLDEQQRTDQEARGLLREMFDDERRVDGAAHDLEVRVRVKDQLTRELSQATKELESLGNVGAVSTRHVVGRTKGLEEQRKELQKEIQVLRKALDLMEVIKPQTIAIGLRSPEPLSPVRTVTEADPSSEHTLARERYPAPSAAELHAIKLGVDERFRQIHQESQTPEYLSQWLGDTYEQAVKDFQRLQERLGSFRNPTWTHELTLLRARHHQLEEEIDAAFQRNEPSTLLVSHLRDQQRVVGNTIHIVEEKLKEYHERLATFGEALRVLGSGRQSADERMWLQASLYNESVTMDDYLAWMTKRRDALSHRWLSWIPSNREQREDLDLRIKYWTGKLQPNQTPYVFPEDRKKRAELESSLLPEVAAEEMEPLSEAQEGVVVEEGIHPTLVADTEVNPTLVSDTVDFVQPKAPDDVVEDEVRSESAERVQHTSRSLSVRAASWLKRWVAPVARVLPFLLLGGGTVAHDEEKPRVEPTVDVAPDVVVTLPEKVPAAPRHTMELPHGSTIWGQMSNRLEAEGLRATNGRIALLTHEALASNGLTAAQAEKLPDNAIIDLTEVDRLIKQIKDAESRL